MSRQSEHKYRVVTPEQKSAGYLELNDGVVAERRQFTIIKKMSDGNYLVEEPSYFPPNKLDKIKDAK